MNAPFDPRDAALFNTLPMLMAPRFGAVPELTVGSKRLIAAANGIFLEVRSPALHVRIELTRLAQPLPYGVVAPFITLSAGPMPSSIVHEAIARAVDACPNETALAVVLDAAGQGYAIQDVRIANASPVAVRYADDLDDDRLVFDVHSHGRASSMFSKTDDASDLSRRGPYIALVIGTCACAETATISARLCCAPYLLPLPIPALQAFGVIA